MFRKAKCFVKLLLITLSLLGGFYLVYIQDRHIQHYNRFVAKHTVEKKPFTEQQVRTGCYKDLYKVDKNERIHYQIFAPTSTLTLEPKSHGFDLVEHLCEMNCLFFETPSKNNAQIKQFQAKNGSYSYTNETLIANDIDFKIYEAPSNHESNNPIMLQGHATEAIFDLSNQTPTFSANHFTADLKS
ncbi:MAG: hypothetical protein K9M07_01865 [Simkaniaceae bacterium]|nr:hypothetical protein [Simkaniaceae bacterium]